MNWIKAILLIFKKEPYFCKIILKFYLDYRISCFDTEQRLISLNPYG